MLTKSYGKELVLDLYNCNSKKFNRKEIARYFRELCDLIEMQRDDMHFWDDVGVPKKDRVTLPHLVGTSAIQFIMTSNVTIHTLDILKRVYLNIFSCKDFDAKIAAEFSRKFFGGKIVTSKVVIRK
ncbi:MAG: hypothetical protein UW12_C0011G0007 [Parcubacteria group bacterium GW2011_GWF1_43_9]|nr:MAG: hypothetical protein UW12_C0011G0007 [Parcubacteria group bacterium GW2011_GWF1_43_9]